MLKRKWKKLNVTLITSRIFMFTSGADLHANAENEDMYAAIDALVDKLDRQVKKHKEKMTDHHRSEGRAQKQI